MNKPELYKDLEKHCHQCKGIGLVGPHLPERESKNDYMCYMCHGSGICITEEGFELLSFLSRHMKVDASQLVGVLKL